MPVFCGCEGCWRADLSPTPQGTLLRAGFAHCGGGMMAARRGAPPASLRVVTGWSLSLPRPPTLGSGGRGPVPVCRGRRGCGLRNSSPTPQHKLLRAGFGAVGAAQGGPGGGGGTSCHFEGSLGSGTLPHPTAVLGAGGQGPLPIFRGRGGCGCGDPSPTPLRTLLRAGSALWGRHEGTREVALCLREGCPGLGTLAPPTARPCGRQPGPAACFLWAQGLRAWGAETNPTAQ